MRNHHVVGIAARQKDAERTQPGAKLLPPPQQTAHSPQPSHGKTKNFSQTATPGALGSHKGKAVRRLIRSAGATLFFLPRYSLDLNPIEQVFAKLKTLLRKTDPRTIEATWRGIGSLLDRFTPKECANYLANAGYPSA